MDEVRIAVCDDDAFALGAITGALQSIFKAKDKAYSVDTYRSVREIEEAMKSRSYDLLLLDIDMPETDGIAFGARLRGKKDSTTILYVSNREERVFESFSVQPLGFVRKSNFFKDLTKYIDLFLENRTNAPDKEMTITADYHGEVFSLPLSSIAYIESQKKNQNVYTANDDKRYTLNMSMQELEDKLESEGFRRIHHGYIVNFRYVTLIGSDTVSLRDGRAVPISRRKVKDVKEQYFEFMRSHGAINI